MTTNVRDADAGSDVKCCRLFDSSHKRLLAGVLILLITLTVNMGMDMPGPMQIFIETTFSLNPYQFEFMYSVFGLPNIILCLFNGILVDKIFGLEMGLIIYGLIALIGQAIITIGGFMQIYWIMLLGRFLYGVGGESVIVLLNCFIVVWFENKEVSIMYGLFSSFTRLGASVAFLMSASWDEFCQKMFNRSTAFGFATLPYLCIIFCQFVVCIALSWYTKRSVDGVKINHSVNLKQILVFRKGYWPLVIMFSTCVNTYFIFISCSQKYLQLKYNVSPEVADNMSSFFVIVAAIQPIFLGILGHLFGRNLTFLTLGIIVGILSQILFIFMNRFPYIPLMLFSLNSSAISCYFWPLLHVAVEPYHIATACGIVACLFCLFFTTYPLVVGFLLGTYGPYAVSIFFLSCLIFGLFCIVLIYVLDASCIKLFNMSGKVKNCFSRNSESQLLQ